RSGFSMVELIFVIVLMGILASIGGNLLPDNRLLNDTNYMIMKIKEKQKNAIGKSTYDFGDELWNSSSSSTCIDLSKSGFESEDLKSQKPHKLSSTLSVDGNVTLCFDAYGRPYQSEQLLLVNKDINVTYNGQMNTISVFPMSGYVILND
ncbi:MAG TPA: prepilin-type N-terminal cleavage/methylation domain-containing protein, partial [Sulfurospirillum arcachonense]|nr:prepilin-type N-terminal cleavage/methylation domain-containing protein [Sulfurospirillum arcachonense]